MSGIRPIGSEKLQGMDKIKRIMEIARFNENIPQSINETAKSEYKITLADGNTYEIVKERQGYIIKSTMNESESEYIEPIRERKYFSSYSQALKRMNLMAKELNELHGNDEGISLIGEQKKKFILKNTKKKTTKSPEGETPTPSVEPAPMAPPPVDSGSAMPPPPTDSEATLPPAPGEMDSTMPPSDMGGGMPPAPSDMGGDMGSGEMPPAPSDMGGDMEGGEMPPPPSDMGGEEMPSSEMGGEMSEPMGDEESTGGGKPRKMSDFKRIQILVGKLAQKIRTYEESDDLSPKDIKYIINSILSAIDVQALDEDDIEQIISKLEGEDEDEEGGGTEDVSDEEEVVNDGGEMDEEYSNYGKSINDYLRAAVTSTLSSKLKESDDFDIDNTEDNFMKFYEKRNQKGSEVSIEDLEDSDTDIEDFKIRRAMKRRPSNSHYHFNRGTYNESKIDKILMGYFKLNENEIKQKYSRLVESDFQMRSLSSFLNENPNSTYMGKTTKGNLIFKNGNKEVKITKSGTLI